MHYDRHKHIGAKLNEYISVSCLHQFAHENGIERNEMKNKTRKIRKRAHNNQRDVIGFHSTYLVTACS